MKTLKTKPGELYKVFVDNREYWTEIDSTGVQRFVENKAIVFLHRVLQPFDLNKLFSAADAGLIPVAHIQSIYVQMGYTVDGFAEVFPRAKIENPVRK